MASVDEIFKDYGARRTEIIRFLTYDVNEFYALSDAEKEDLCLLGHPNESWEVTLPAEEVPPELPEPALGINFARGGINPKDWLSWFLSVAFYFGGRLNRNERLNSTSGNDRTFCKFPESSYHLKGWSPHSHC
ncbi:hypothetical protein NE237_010399 [Protea cynaroides]|uniref:PHD finger protein ALFIN-LIKE n=1 Tax=Protea cynaroides TaxID=273540 RepID=A0A9Q0R1J1_9MAGN|nr:hypothetical protein NE237_010399 [Protea cynaroides]